MSSPSIRLGSLRLGLLPLSLLFLGLLPLGLLPLGLLVAPAHASPPPPDYRAEVVGAVTVKLEIMGQNGDLEGVLKEGRRFQKHVQPAAPVAYEMALAANRLGRTGDAIALYDEVTSLAPDHAAAWYDRGELHLSEGDDGDARRDFEAAAKLRPDHWVVHFRLAHLAGRAQDGRAFEEHLTQALRNGFAFQTILDDPTWRAWASDPVLGPVIVRLIVVYDDESLLERLRGTP
jgi:hypothetical protein